jgi:uncharacterized protein (DUF1330 family)
MKYYTVAEIEITEHAWVRDYVANVTKLIERNGGRYLARTSNVQRIEGERKLPQIFLIIEWPSKEIADTLYQSEEYKPNRQSRLAGAKSELVLVASEDVTKTAHIPDQQ